MARCVPNELIKPLSLPLRRAFTLVELLVVIAIIALLLAILLPTLSAVRASANRSATQSLLADISRASDSFIVDNRRVPGLIPDSVLYPSGGGDPVLGMTATDNAMLELVGGGIRSIGGDSSVIDTVDDEILLHTDGDTRYYASPTLLGEGGYLQLDGRNLAQLGEPARQVPIPSGGQWNMPTIVDNFGTPVLLFRQSGARFSNPNDGNFALVGTRIGSGYDGSRWYWWDTAHVWGFVGAKAQDPDEFTDPAKNGSWLFYDGTPSAATRSAFMAVLEHPTLYEDTPRGKYVLVSAGSDGIYFGRRQLPAVGDPWKGRYEIHWGASGNPGDSDLDKVVDISTTFDDIIVSGG